MATGTRLASKVALITGAGSGFGRAISHRFAQEGARILSTDINEGSAKETVSRAHNSSDHSHAAFDVTNPQAWKKTVDQALDKFGRLDVVINNAGWSYVNKPTLDVEEKEFQRCFDLNVKSIFWSVPEVVRAFRKNGGEGGSLINISSIGSERPRPGLVWYNASKAAVSNASKALAAEFGPEQIRVNAVCPLLSNTGLFENFAGVPHTEENVKKFVSQVPLARLTEPVDVANLCLYLASDEGKFTTGQNLVLDGGKGI